MRVSLIQTESNGTKQENEKKNRYTGSNVYLMMMF